MIREQSETHGLFFCRKAYGKGEASLTYAPQKDWIMTRIASFRAFKMLDVFIAILIFELAIPTPAYAYVDPSVMTYTIQAIAGVIVGLSAVIGVALRRTRKFIFRVFNIDENANKIKEPAVSQIDTSDPDAVEQLEAADEAALQDRAALARGPRAKSLVWHQRFVRALIACALPVFTLIIASTLEIVAGAANSLNFTFFDVIPIVLAIGTPCWLILACLVSLLRGRPFDVVNTLMFTIGLCFYVQALFLNWPMSVADGSPLDLGSKKLIASMIGGALVWICLIAGMLVFNAKRRSICRGFVMAISCALIVVQGVSLISIGADEQERIANAGPKTLISQKGLFEVSAEDNVIVFVLDTTDTQIMEYIRENDPSALDEFTGFTYFRNSVGSMEPTRYGIPYLLTGVGVEEGDTRASYLERRSESTEFLEEISELGYSINIYSTSIGNSNLYDYMDNIVYLEPGDFEIDYSTLPTKLIKMSCYRDLPWVLKPIFLFSTDEINQSSLNEELNAYVTNDIAYANRLFDGGLRVNNNGKEFRFIHLLGSHYPYTMDEQGHDSGGRTGMAIQTQGIFRVVGEYLHQLKELGLYDQASIVITADHGIWYANRNMLPQAVSPIMLVKPPETAEEAAQPMKVSDVPTGHLDFNATIIDFVGGDSSAYGPTVFEISDEDRPRYFWRTTMDSGQTNADLDWTQYEINGDALNFDDWSLTGKVIPITSTN